MNLCALMCDKEKKEERKKKKKNRKGREVERGNRERGRERERAERERERESTVHMRINLGIKKGEGINISRYLPSFAFSHSIPPSDLTRIRGMGDTSVHMILRPGFSVSSMSYRGEKKKKRKRERNYKIAHGILFLPIASRHAQLDHARLSLN